jgi:hypothetical protein
MSVISDNRGMSIDDAKSMFAEYAQAKKGVAKLRAQSELRIANEKARTDEACEPFLSRMAAIEKTLSEFVRANAEKYFTRPRKVTTDFGKFGLDRSSKVEVLDADAVIAHAKEAGDMDLVKVTERVATGELAKRLRAGETIPGAELLDGDLVVLTVDRTYLEE